MGYRLRPWLHLSIYNKNQAGVDDLGAKYTLPCPHHVIAALPPDG